MRGKKLGVGTRVSGEKSGGGQGRTVRETVYFCCIKIVLRQPRAGKRSTRPAGDTKNKNHGIFAPGAWGHDSGGSGGGAAAAAAEGVSQCARNNWQGVGAKCGAGRGWWCL